MIESPFFRVLLYFPVVSPLKKYASTTDAPIKEIRVTNVTINTNSNNPQPTTEHTIYKSFRIHNRLGDIPTMGSNQLDLILSLIDDSEHNLRERMKRSSDSTSSILLKHIQCITNNANYSDTFECININAVAMARWAKPEGWDYALMACYSMKNHMKFLSTAIENILGEVFVLADYVSSLSRITKEEEKALTFEDTKVSQNRLHSLGGVRLPDPKSIASAAILQSEGLANIGLIREAMGRVQLENDIFERENEIN